MLQFGPILQSNWTTLWGADAGRPAVLDLIITIRASSRVCTGSRHPAFRIFDALIGLVPRTLNRINNSTFAAHNKLCCLFRKRRVYKVAGRVCMYGQNTNKRRGSEQLVACRHLASFWSSFHLIPPMIKYRLLLVSMLLRLFFFFFRQRSMNLWQLFDKDEPNVALLRV